MSSIPTNISVSLSSQADSHWKSCFDLTHELIITCRGRRVFPTLEYEIQGLNPLKYYSMCIHFELVDDMKLRYVNGKWTESLSTEEKDIPRRVFHIHLQKLGKDWMNEPLSFDQIRVTNRKSNERNKGPSFVYLLTQHKYIPILTVYDRIEVVHIFKTAHTEFIAVTSYHSNAINELKKNINPYAKGTLLRQKRVESSPNDSYCSESFSPLPLKKIKKEKEEEGEEKREIEDLVAALINESNSLLASLSSSWSEPEPATILPKEEEENTETTTLPVVPVVPNFPCFPNTPLIPDSLQPQNILQNQTNLQQQLMAFQMPFVFPQMLLNPFLNPLFNPLFPTPTVSSDTENQIVSPKTEPCDSENI